MLPLGVAVALIAGGVGIAVGDLPEGSARTPPPPPPGGYFSLVPNGRFSSLPDDAAAERMVHRSPWEVRPSNSTANSTMPPSGFRTPGYSGMLHHGLVFGRVTGHFTGTTDEILQWAAAKWGLPDEVLRAQAVEESSWYQDRKGPGARPLNKQGYGDFGACGGSPAPSGYGARGPASFGLLQDKWCSLQNPNTRTFGGWPYSERSTAYSVDLSAAVLRGCYEGWDTWLGPDYRAGDLWGCLGRWYTGTWHTSDANAYIARVQRQLHDKPWRRWSSSGQ